MSLPRLLTRFVSPPLLGLSLSLAHAAPLGTAFVYTGEYKPGGTAVTGVYDFQLVLFPALTGGTAVRTVTLENVAVSQGRYSAEVDYGATPFATATQYWVETRVRAGTSTGAFAIVTPRKKLTAVPYALNVRTLPPGVVTGSTIAANAVGTVAILDNSITATDIGTNAVGVTEINATQVQARVSGVCAPGSSIRAIGQTGTVTCEVDGVRAWRLGGNSGTNPATQFLGTTDTKAFALRVNNQRALLLEPNPISPNVIGGSRGNFATAGVRGATISGGGTPSGVDDPGFSNEAPNRVTEVYSTVGGGLNNQAGNNTGTITDGAFATVGGGILNTASGYASIVPGGYHNTASGLYSTVGGGFNNAASGLYSTVGGGHNNTASATSTVGGGFNNTASGLYSTVAGGLGNTTSNYGSTVGGGIGNTVNGEYSFAVGHHTNVSHNYSFVWSGWNSGGATSFAPNRAQFFGEHGLGVDYCARRADGGGTCWVLIDTIFGHAISTFTGGFLSLGGVWTNASDKNAKTAFAAIDPQEVLAEVVQLPLTTWQYKAEKAEVRHLGPMAQDFHAAFQLGENDTTISTVDASGVALAAIQGLNQKLEAENAKLKARLAELEAKVAKQAGVQTRLEALEARFEALFHARVEQ